MSLKKESIKSVLSNWGATFLQYAISFIATPIIVHSLGNDKYGIWSLVISFTGYYGIIDFGIMSTIVKYFSQFLAKDDKINCNKLSSTAIFIYIFISIFLLIATLSIAFNFDKIFNIDAVYKQEALIITIIIGGNLALSFIFKTFNAIVVALRRFDINNAVRIICSIARTIVIIIFLKMNYSLIAMAIIVLCFDTLANLIYVVVVFKLVKGLRIKTAYFSKDIIKEVYSFAGYNFLIHFSRIIIERTDQVLIGIFLGLKYIVFYSIAESLVNYIRKIPKGIITTLLPLASHLDAKGDTYHLEVLLYTLPKYMLSFMLFILYISFEYGKTFIRLWMGQGFDDSYILLIILLSSQIFFQTTSIIGRTFAGMNKNKEYTFISVIEMILNIVLSIILLKYWGMIGIALGTLISSIITKCIILPMILSKSGIFSITKCLNQTVWPPLFSFLLFILCYGLITYFSNMNHNSIVHLLLSMGGGILLYAIISYVITFKEIRLHSGKFIIQI